MFQPKIPKENMNITKQKDLFVLFEGMTQKKKRYKRHYITWSWEMPTKGVL